jgi:hypothetical protein
VNGAVTKIVVSRSNGPVRKNFRTPVMRFKTSKGIGIGSSKKAMCRAYGKRMKRVRSVSLGGEDTPSYILKGRGKWETHFRFFHSTLIGILFRAKPR